MPMIFTIFVAVMSITDGVTPIDALGALTIAGFPLALSLAFVLPACLVIGLPATALLRATGLESSSVYVVLGGCFGFLLPLGVLALMNAEEGWWLALLGAFSGAVTGKTWWAEARDPLVR